MKIQRGVLWLELIGLKKPSQINAVLRCPSWLGGGGTMQNNASH
jgi:hypothetical protein